LERTSTTLKESAARDEECWVLVGERRGDTWQGRMLDRVVGQPEMVEFDGGQALAREEALGDVIGFMHTHPNSAATPSQRDVDTMQAWVSALGKPLLCVIQGTDGLRCYRFEDDASGGEQMSTVERTDDRIVAIQGAMTSRGHS